MRIMNHVYDKKKLTEFRNFNQMKNVSWVSIFNKSLHIKDMIKSHLMGVKWLL